MIYFRKSKFFVASFRVLICDEDVERQARQELRRLQKRLEDNGASAIMPLASPIGSGLGLLNKVNISLIIKQAKVPVIVDAGIGTASDATVAMELGCDGVLINSAIANSKKPILMARAFKDAVVSGRNSYLAGRMNKNYFAKASSPTKGLI